MLSFYNIFSLFLGLISWILPIYILLKERKFSTLALCINIITSFTCCGVSLSLQLLEIHDRIRVEDFSGLMDTIDSITGAAIGLVLVTVILNLLALRNETKK